MIALIAMLEAVFKVTIVLGVAWGVASLLRHRAPATVHLVWLVAIGSIVILPLITVLVPRQKVPVPGLSANSSSQAPVVDRSETALAGLSLKGHLVRRLGLAEDAGSRFQLSIWDLTALALASTWGIGALIGLVRLGVELMRLRTHVAIARLSEGGPASKAMLHRYSKSLPRIAGIYFSDHPDFACAMTWGWLKPVVFLPSEAHDWSESRLHAVMAHELAHVRRADFVSQILARFACAVYWFHPLVSFAARQMREQAELAADAAVLSTGIKASAYAAELVGIAVQVGGRSSKPTLQGVSVMSNQKIEKRVSALLYADPHRKGFTKIQALSAMVVVALAIPGLAALQGAPQGTRNLRPDSEIEESRMRLKSLSLGTIMYAEDYDEDFPYARNTSNLFPVLQPYLKSKTVCESPTPGGKYVFNRNLGGVNLKAIGAKYLEVGVSAQTRPDLSRPLWVEELPNRFDKIVVADVTAQVLTVSGTDRKLLDEGLAKQWPRAATMRPIDVPAKAPVTR